MARLAIYNGNALVREIDVPEGTLRVGRNDQNDIVLLDPGKAVSRFHAELHIERGTCTIVDLNSQNGTWVAGRRVPQATLMPGQAAVVGTHRLVFKGEANESQHSTAAVAAVAPPPPALACNQVAQEPALALPTTPATPPGDAALPPSAASRLARSEAKPSPASDHDQLAARALPPSSLTVNPRVRVRRALKLLAGGLCLAAAGVAGGFLWWPAAHAAPSPAARSVQTSPDQPVPGGPPTETPAADAAAPAALAAGTAAVPGGIAPTQQPSVVAPPVSAPTTTSQTPSDAAASGGRAVLPAGMGKAQSPVARKATEPRSQEGNNAALIERARTAVRRGDYAAALGFLQPVMRVDAGNSDALDLLAAVRSQGHDAFRRARQFDGIGRTAEAVPLYERAVRLLPPDHPNAQLARQRLADLRSQ